MDRPAGRRSVAPAAALRRGRRDRARLRQRRRPARRCSVRSAARATRSAPFDQKIVGPGLGHIFNDSAHPKLVNGTAPTPQDVAAIIHNGYSGDIGTMPSAQVNGLSNTDIANLVAYLVSLSKK